MTLKKIAINVIIGIAISVLFTFLLVYLSAFWQSWLPATCLPDKCFCEFITNNQIKQLSNTWSSYSFVIVGMVMLSLLNHKNIKKRFNTNYQLIFIFSSIFVGLGSAFYHASLTFWGQFFDVFSMYLFITFILVYAWERLYNFHQDKTIFLYILLNFIFILFLLFIPSTRRFLFAVLLVVSIIFEILATKRKSLTIKLKWFYSGISVFAFAFLIWILDITKLVCVPNSIWQGHALWHILGSIAIFMVYIYFLSEESAI